MAQLHDVDRILEEFISASDDARKYLDEMLSDISEGKAPRRDILGAYTELVEVLEEKYDAAFVLASELPEEEFKAEKGLPIYDYADAIKSSKYATIKKQIEAARDSLQQFVEVKALAETYSEALYPYQEKAKELLKTLSADAFEGIGHIGELTAGPELFLQAMRIEDLDSDEALDLLDELGEYYKNRVVNGLARRKYYLDEIETVEDSEPEIVDVTTPATTVSNFKEEVVTEETTSEPMADSAEEEVNDNQEQEEALTERISDDELEGEMIEASDNENAENVAKMASEERENEEKSIVSDKKIKTLSKIKTSTPSASKFEKEVKKMTWPARFILPVLTNVGILTSSQMGPLYECIKDDKAEWSAEEVENAIPTLESKGYLNAYKTSSGDYAYMLSEYACGCMRKKSIAGMDAFWILSVQDFIAKGEEFVSEQLIESVVSRNEKLITYLSGMRRALSQDDYLMIQQSVKADENRVRVELIDDNIIVEAELFDGFKRTALDPEETYLIVDDDWETVVAKNKGITFYLYHNDKVELVTESNIADYYDYNDAADNEKDNPAQSDSEEENEGNAEQISILDITEENSDATKGILDQAAGSEDTYLSELISTSEKPSEKAFIDLINSVLNGELQCKFNKNSDVIQSLLLAKAGSINFEYKELQNLYAQLLLATNIGIDKAVYTSEKLAEAFPDHDNAPEALMLAAYMYALLVPGQPYDFALASQADDFLHDFELYFPSLEGLKPLFNKLNEVRRVSPAGFTKSIVSQLGSAEEGDRLLKRIQMRAEELYTVASPKTRMRDIRPFYKDCFGEKSRLREEGLEIVAENRVEDAEFVKELLESFCDVRDGIYTINSEKTNGILQEHWFNVNSQGKSFELEFDAKSKAYRRFEERIQVLIDWVEHISVGTDGKVSIPQLKKFKEQLLELAEDGLRELENSTVEYRSIIQWMLRTVINTISGADTSDTFKELLITGIISLDENGMPVIEEELNEVLYYEPWRNVLRHMNSEVKSISETVNLINDKDSLMFDNLNQLKLLGKLYQLDEDDYDYTEDDVQVAIANADGVTTTFEERLELAYTYDQISETEKESLLAIMTSHREQFYERKDFGIWKQFLKALEKSIDEAASKRIERLRVALAEAKSQFDDESIPQTLREAERFLEEDENCAVAEEQINRFNNTDGDLTVDYNNVLLDPDSFEEFLSVDVFDSLYEECIRHKGATLNSFGEKYLIKHFPENWTNQNRESSKNLLANWPGQTKGINCGKKIESLFRLLGFKVKEAKTARNIRAEAYQLTVEPTKKSLADYSHPISAFGTDLKSPLNVVLLHGQNTASQIVNLITGLNLGGITIVLLDGAMDRATRRQMCERFHNNTTGLNPFIVIDRVLLLHLALHQQTERLPVLLKCTLPYTSYQPFVRGQGPTADEMFCGRATELAAIMNPQGACVVYGGRQLGKTALLMRAESLGMRPDEKRYAIYSSLLTCKNEAAMVETIVSDINKKSDLRIESCKTLKTLSARIYEKMKSGKINSFHLLLDETDKVLESMAENRYEQLQPFVQLRQDTSNSFKFVLAGLHNVCRAQHATSENGIFGQLGTPLCIKPLSPTDALLLLSRPLRYIGFKIDRYPHLETILTKTIYYPGILQFFGYRLVETMTSQYAKYYSAVEDNPPFTLTKDQLGAIMNSADLNDSIKERFRWTLDLDPRYFMLARCVAMLYFYNEDNSNNWKGFPVEEIMDMVDTYGINCLKGETERSIILLLDEMEEMGILTKTEDRQYRLRRASFVDIIGKDFETIEADIENNNKES